MTLILIVFVLLTLFGITAIVSHLIFSKKFDKFEYEFKRAHQDEFVGSFDYDAFCLRHHDD